MKKHLINLTIPLKAEENLSLPAFKIPFQSEAVLDFDINGVCMECYEFDTMTGTRIITSGLFNKDGSDIASLNFSDFIQQQTAVVVIPKSFHQDITLDEIEKYIGEAKHYSSKDSLLIIIEGERAEDTPSNIWFSLEGARRLGEIVKEKESKFVAINSDFIHSNPTYMKEWLATPYWQRPHWPSEEATLFLEYYKSTMFKEDYQSHITQLILESAPMIIGLTNCKGITRGHVSLTAAPLYILDSPASPATVIAEIMGSSS